MKAIELLPYFHPTQVVLVDDDIDFLGNLSLQLDADLAYLLFDSAAKALHYINGRDNQARSRERFFDIADARVAPGEARMRVALDTDALVKEMHFTDRFAQISVVMADYAMPQMNGIELCERIRNPQVKKILFTDVDTEADAIAALNRGVIDRYICKRERHVYARINSAIFDLQRAYIADTFAAARDVFELDPPVMLADPKVAALLRKLITRYGIVEYYMTARPAGFLLLDGNAHLYRCVLSDEGEQATQLTHARERNAPRACLEALQHGEMIMAPAIQSGSPAEQTEHYRHWQDYALTATPLRGMRDYRWAVSDSAVFTCGVEPPSASYYRYLEWLDTVGYSLM